MVIVVIVRAMNLSHDHMFITSGKTFSAAAAGKLISCLIKMVQIGKRSSPAQTLDAADRYRRGARPFSGYRRLSQVPVGASI